MRLLFIFAFLLSTSLWANQVDKLKEVQGQSDVELTVTFSDGFKQNIRGPITVEKGPQVRCPCEMYTISFFDEKGNRQTRSVKVNLIGERVEWTGSDGNVYGLDSIRSAGEKVAAKKEAPKPTCRLAGKMDRVKIIPSKVVNNDNNSCPKNALTSCVGEAIVKCEGVMECENDPTYGSETYNLFCMSKNSQTCPTMEECIADTAYEEFETKSKSEGFNLQREELKTKGK